VRQQRGSPIDPQAVIGAEQGELFRDKKTEGAAELIPLVLGERLSGLIEEIGRVEIVVAVKFVDRAVETRRASWLQRD